MPVFEYRFPRPEKLSDAEKLIAQLDFSGFSGFQELEDHILAYVEGESLSNPPISLTELSSLTEIGEDSVTIVPMEDQNWNATWEQEFEPIIVDKRLRVRAHFHPRESAYEHDLVITPKMSFGTGHHETTRMMMRFLLQTSVNGVEVLDMGSGTAILAVLACRLGAKSVIAVDNDPWAFENGKENILRNNCSDVIEPLLGTVKSVSERKFDLILANINRNIILKDLGRYRTLMKERGTLILSGIMNNDLPIIIKEAQKFGFQPNQELQEGSWSAALLSC